MRLHTICSCCNLWRGQGQGRQGRQGRADEVSQEYLAGQGSRAEGQRRLEQKEREESFTGRSMAMAANPMQIGNEKTMAKYR